MTRWYIKKKIHYNFYEITISIEDKLNKQTVRYFII